MPIPIEIDDNLSVSSVTERIKNIKSSESNDFDFHFLTPSDTLIELNISEAISKGDLAALEKILLTDLKTTPKNFQTPAGNLLHLAVSLARVDDFRKIFHWLQINPNEQTSKDGSTPLHLAVRLNRLEIVEFLLELPEIDDTIKDFEGKTCLDYCRNRTIKTLFENSRSAFKEKMMKFLFKAAYKNKIKDICDALNNSRCANLIDFNSQNSRGDTLLHVAAKNESEEVLRELLKLGIDPYIKNKKGKMAIEVTSKPSIKELLKNAPMKRSKEIPSSPVGLKMKGYLYKYTNIGFGYRPRWFVLDNGILSYYNSQSDYPVSCRGSLNLQYFRIEPHPKQACKFSLIGRSENLVEVKIHLRAEAQDEAKRWIIALQQSRDFYADFGEDLKQKDAFLSANLMSLMNSPALTATPPTLATTISSQPLNELDLTFMTILKQERFILDSSLSVSEKETIMDNLRALKELLQKIEQTLAQKTRRLEAQRKEKDLLEDAVRSLAMENNKWQTWARAQLSPSSSATIKRNVQEDIFIKSLENQLEATNNEKLVDTEDEFYDLESSSNDEDFDVEPISDIDNEDDLMSDDDIDIVSDKEEEDISLESTESLKETVGLDQLGYPLRGRKVLPADSTKMPAISLWNILKNAIRQQDLTRMPIPINFSEPLSMLQRMSEDLEYFDLIKQAREMNENPAKRLLLISAFAVTSYSSTDKRTLKPFNPLLGETFELACEDFFYLAEQVSHHPPIGASYCCGVGFEYWNEVHVTSRFRGKYLELKPEGNSHLVLGSPGQHFTWNRVNTAVNNIIVGKLYLEHYGKMIVKTHDGSGLEAEIEFLPNGWRKDSINRIKGRIWDSRRIYYEISGRWNESISAKSPENSSETFTVWLKQSDQSVDSEKMYNFNAFAMRLNELNLELKRKLCPTDSRFRPDQRAMEEGHFDAASRLKAKLEEKQRRARKAEPEERPPRWFTRQIDPQTGQGFWKYLGGYWETRNSGKWTDIPDIYL